MTTLWGRMIGGLAILAVWGCGPDGEKARDFSIVPLEDQARRVSLADFKGKTVLLDFWATWCGPCRQSMPEIQEVWDTYRSKGLEVASISNEDRDTVLRFHKQFGYTYPVYLDRVDNATRAMGVGNLPTFVILREGRVVWREEGFAPGMIRDAVKNLME